MIFTKAGLSRIFIAKALMGSGIVAEKSRVCRVLGRNLKISSISSKKPISSISSLSSSTTICGAKCAMRPFCKWSSSLPGVAIITFGFFSNKSHCRLMLCPPYIQMVLIRPKRPSFRISSLICIASSLVGVMTSASIS